VRDRRSHLPEKRDVDRTTVGGVHAGETAHGARSRGAMVAEVGSQAGMRTSTA
jgi:hypothetical protein